MQDVGLQQNGIIDVINDKHCGFVGMQGESTTDFCKRHTRLLAFGVIQFDPFPGRDIHKLLLQLLQCLRCVVELSRHVQVKSPPRIMPAVTPGISQREFRFTNSRNSVDGGDCPYLAFHEGLPQLVQFFTSPFEMSRQLRHLIRW